MLRWPVTRQCLDSGTPYTKVNAVIVQILLLPANLVRLEGNQWMVASLCLYSKASITLDRLAERLSNTYKVQGLLPAQHTYKKMFKFLVGYIGVPG